MYAYSTFDSYTKLGHLYLDSIQNYTEEIVHFLLFAIVAIGEPSRITFSSSLIFESDDRDRRNNYLVNILKTKSLLEWST